MVIVRLCWWWLRWRSWQWCWSHGRYFVVNVVLVYLFKMVVYARVLSLLSGPLHGSINDPHQESLDTSQQEIQLNTSIWSYFTTPPVSWGKRHFREHYPHPKSSQCTAKNLQANQSLKFWKCFPKFSPWKHRDLTNLFLGPSMNRSCGSLWVLCDF